MAGTRRAIRGFTLVELLVVIAIIGVLVSLLLPALSSVRESARSASCKSNLKQLGLAVHMYQTAHRVYPPSFEIDTGTSLTTNNGSWSIHGRLLPFLEHGFAYDMVDLDQPWDLQRDTGIPTMRVPTYLCASEEFDQVRLDDSGNPKVYPQNYGFNFGSWLVYDPATDTGGDGAFHPNSRLRPRNFHDGLSRTLGAADVKAYTSYLRNTGGDPGDRPTTVDELVGMASGGQAKLGPNTNKNTGHTEWCDGRVHHSGITTVFTPNTFVSYESGGKTYDIDFNSMQEGKGEITKAAVTARSYHPGHVNVLMMDGSINIVEDDVDPTVWQRMGTRSGDG